LHRIRYHRVIGHDCDLLLGQPRKSLPYGCMYFVFFILNIFFSFFYDYFQKYLDISTLDPLKSKLDAVSYRMTHWQFTIGVFVLFRCNKSLQKQKQRTRHCKIDTLIAMGYHSSYRVRANRCQCSVILLHNIMYEGNSAEITAILCCFRTSTAAAKTRRASTWCNNNILWDCDRWSSAEFRASPCYIIVLLNVILSTRSIRINRVVRYSISYIIYIYIIV